MNKLTIINKFGRNVTDSREVANMTTKRHDHLLRDIKGYVEVLDHSPTLVTADFFIEDIYQNENNQSYPCYLLTKKGCDMVANKMTGEKGILFTAEYVTEFENMEQSLKTPKPTCIEDVLIQSLQEMKDVRQQLNEVNHKVLEAKAESTALKDDLQNIRDIILIDPKAEWRKESSRIINKIAVRVNDYEAPRKESYDLLTSKTNCRLSVSLNNLKGRAMLNGMTKSKIDNLNNLDVIENDKKLKEIYIQVIREMAIKYGVA